MDGPGARCGKDRRERHKAMSGNQRMRDKKGRFSALDVVGEALVYGWKCLFLVVIGAIGEGSLPCGLVWTGVDFSVCVVAPPGERSVGAGRGVG